ncbi:hypothetical protein A0256_03410 [Mucilaginibacter sp. PAMC 26640]|nr:hypothetical protein A0256_03410 [Mucilaginibacter sp. PAMC 26640]
MKSDIFKLVILNSVLLVVLLCPSCKKDVELPKSLTQTTNETTPLATSALSTINLVTTLAGVRNTPGYADGPAQTAMFNGVSGIQLTSDGTLYIADKNNNAIRKLTAGGIVSTLPLKTTGDYPLQSPTSVGVDNIGNVHVLSYLVDQEGLFYIFNNKGNLLTGYGLQYIAFGALAKDPYENFLWFSIHNSIGKHVINADGSTGKDYIPYNNNLLTDDEQGRGQSFRGLFVGRNRVIYFAIGPRLFKYTPSGTTAQLFPNLALSNISSIVLNADCRTMYLASGGKIVKIENGKLSVLAGPNTLTPDGRDGKGANADVHANSLALGDNENSLYFSDYSTNTIRKIMLK